MPLEISSGITESWRSSNFDSRLELTHVSQSRNADLRLHVAVYFCRIEPPDTLTDSLGNTLTVLSWGGEAEWLDWVRRCRNVIERRFNNRLWLTPSGYWGVLFRASNGYYIPNVKCGLMIHPVEWGERYHLKLNCYRVPPNFCPLTPAAAGAGPLYISYMDGNQGRIVNVDAWSCYTHTEGHVQDVAAHEFGHFLGLDHVGIGSQSCPPSGNTNATPCYGITVRQRSDLEGWGNRIDAWHSHPWARRMTRHQSRSVTWQGTIQRPVPRFIADAGTQSGDRDQPAPRITNPRWA